MTPLILKDPTVSPGWIRAERKITRFLIASRSDFGGFVIVRIMQEFPASVLQNSCFLKYLEMRPRELLSDLFVFGKLVQVLEQLRVGVRVAICHFDVIVVVFELVRKRERRVDAGVAVELELGTLAYSRDIVFLVGNEDPFSLPEGLGNPALDADLHAFVVERRWLALGVR
jgi:hypothetical protein